MTGSGAGGRAALEQDGMLRADGAEADSALLKIEGLSKPFGGTQHDTTTAAGTNKV
jgi:hypothetical protein